MSSGGPPLRVAFIGNVANTHFRAALALRACGVEVELFISDIDAPASRPENDDPSLAGAYPDWIHGGPWITPRTLLAPWRAPVTRQLATYDAVVASGPGPIFAQFAGVPWAFYATGGDLTVKPFPVAFWRWYPNWPHRAAELVAGSWQRRAARRPDQLWSQPFAPMVDALARVRAPASLRGGRHLPIVVDTEAYRPDVALAADATAWVAEATQGAGLVVFHPSRLVMEATPPLVRTGQWKGNGTLLRGFAAFARTAAGADALLLLPDTPLSRDRAPARALVAELGIEDRVRWLVPPGGQILDRDHMVALYQRADVVADEFGVGWFGYVALEGLAMEAAVIGNIDEAAMAQLYPDHPIRSADTSEAVARELGWAAEERAAGGGGERGAAGRAWVVAHHGPEASAAAFAAAVAELAGR